MLKASAFGCNLGGERMDELLGPVHQLQRHRICNLVEQQGQGIDGSPPICLHVIFVLHLAAVYQHPSNIIRWSIMVYTMVKGGDA